MITVATLASIGLIIAATEVVAHGFARIRGLDAEITPRYSVISGRVSQR